MEHERTHHHLHGKASQPNPTLQRATVSAWAFLIDKGKFWRCDISASVFCPPGPRHNTVCGLANRLPRSFLMLSKSRKKRTIFAASMLAIGTTAIAKTWTWALPEPPSILPTLRAAQVAAHELGQKKKPVKNDQVRASFSGINNPAGVYLKVSSLSSIRYHELTFSECGGGDGGVVQ